MCQPLVVYKWTPECLYVNFFVILGNNIYLYLLSIISTSEDFIPKIYLFIYLFFLFLTKK